MADNEEGEEHVNEWDVSNNTAVNEDGGEALPGGNDWEVVSLTASAYAASPGQRGNESIHESSESTVYGKDEAETSRALFMSVHFAFPPSQHENLPIATEKLETGKQDDLVTEMNVLKEGKHEEKIDNDEKWGLEGWNVKEEGFLGIPLFEEKGHMTLPSIDSEFDEPYDEKEQDLYNATKLSSFHSATVIDDPAVNNLVEAFENVIDPSSYLRSKATKSVKEDEDEDDECKLPCGAWWKRGVASLYAQAKETGAFWSIFVAAAVMGLVVLGHRWHQERLQILHHRWQLSIDEKPGRILSRVKDMIVEGSLHGTSVTWPQQSFKMITSKFL